VRERRLRDSPPHEWTLTPPARARSRRDSLRTSPNVGLLEKSSRDV